MAASRVSTSILFSEPILYLIISPRPFEDRAAAVTGFAKKGGPAEKKGVRVGWVLAAVDRVDCLQKTFAQTLALYRSANRPVELKFVRDPDYTLVVHEAPTDLRFEPALDECVVAPFNSPPGPAELMLGARLKVGDYVLGVNRVNTSRMSAASVVKLLQTSPRPVEIRFGREGHKQQLVAAAIFEEGPMGLLLRPKGSRVRFIRFHGIGPVERSGAVTAGNILIGINGVPVRNVNHAKELLSRPPPLEMRFRKMEVYLEGGWPPSSSALVSRGRILYDFAGSQMDDLPVRAGDVVEILEHNADFWLCKDLRGRSGWVPSSYIEKLSAMERLARDPSIEQRRSSSDLRRTSDGSLQGSEGERRAMLAKQGMELLEIGTSPKPSFDSVKHLRDATSAAAGAALVNEDLEGANNTEDDDDGNQHDIRTRLAEEEGGDNDNGDDDDYLVLHEEDDPHREETTGAASKHVPGYDDEDEVNVMDFFG